MLGTIREMARYGLKGAGATLANIALMTALVETDTLGETVAPLVSTSLLLLVGYAVMNRFVFPGGETPDSRRAHLRRGLAYYAVILSGKAVNYALFVGLLAVDVWYPLAWLLGSVTVFFGTFSANRWLWHRGVTS